MDCIPENDSLTDSSWNSNAAVASLMKSLAATDDDNPRFILEQAGDRLSRKTSQLGDFCDCVGKLLFHVQLRYRESFAIEITIFGARPIWGMIAQFFRGRQR